MTIEIIVLFKGSSSILGSVRQGLNVRNSQVEEVIDFSGTSKNGLVN